MDMFTVPVEYEEQINIKRSVTVVSLAEWHGPVYR